MELKHRFQPTMIHTNARFRGPTESLKYSNMINETVHDLILLATILDRNRGKGQSDYIENNFSQYLNGEGNEIYANIPSVAKFAKVLGEKIEDLDLTDSDWASYGGCVVSGTKAAPVLLSEGAGDPCGVAYSLDVEEGEILYIQMNAALVSGDNTFLSIGSEDVNQGEGFYKIFTLSNQESEGYIDAVIRCRHRERIKLNIDLFRGAERLSSKSVKVLGLKILQLEEVDLKVEPTNSNIKSRINKISNEIANLKNIL